MVSLDIKSLLTKIHVQEELQVIQQKLEEDKTLGDRTALTFDQATKLLQLLIAPCQFADCHLLSSPDLGIKFNSCAMAIKGTVICPDPPLDWVDMVPDQLSIIMQTVYSGTIGTSVATIEAVS